MGLISKKNNCQIKSDEAIHDLSHFKFKFSQVWAALYAAQRQSTHLGIKRFWVQIHSVSVNCASLKQVPARGEDSTIIQGIQDA